MKATKNIGILVFDDVEVLDYCGPFEVFSVCSAEIPHDVVPFKVFLIAKNERVRTVGGMNVLVENHFTTVPRLDVLIVPGGSGSRQAALCADTIRFVQETAKSAQIVASVCTGTRITVTAGLVESRRVTTHWEALDDLERSLPNGTVVRNKHWVCDGKLWSSAGISTGIDMSLKLVEHFCDEETARATAKYMEYPFPESDARRI